MDVSTIPIIGWLVILTTIILLFLLAWFKGFRINKDGANIGIEKQLSDYENMRARDENKRVELYKTIELIDKSEFHNITQTVEIARKKLRNLIRSRTKCGVALNHVVYKVGEALTIKLEEDDFRRRLCPINIDVYKKDVLLSIEYEYDEIKRLLSNIDCKEELIPFSEIEGDCVLIINDWCEEVKKHVVYSCSEKIKTYETYKNFFELEAYKSSFVNVPLDKNRTYLKGLTKN